MKRLTLEATEENILNSIKDNTYNRCRDIRDFIEVLDTIDGNMFISLDARWGEGKTFFVRQIEKTLEYMSKKSWEEEYPGLIDDLKPYFQNAIFTSLELEKTYLPIYYNAWLYDNHDDPLMSLIFTIVKKAESYLDMSMKPSLGEKIKSLLSSISLATDFSIGSTANGGVKTVVQMAVNGEGIIDAFSSLDILKSVKTSEQIRDMVKDILDDVIAEKADKLVLIIDELDRCRPSYAIEMLERIKHYFDDERIIFIVSINKEQLVHTISKYYGYGFDSTGYLNKFFDVNAHIPAPQMEEGPLFGSFNSRQYYLNTISGGLSDYYKLSLRDSLILKQRISSLAITYVNDESARGCCLSLFIPLIIVLDLKDENGKVKFLNGESDIVERLANQIPAIQDMMRRFCGNTSNEPSEMFGKGLSKFVATYKYAFNGDNNEFYNEHVLRCGTGMRRLCIQLIHGVTR